MVSGRGLDLSPRLRPVELAVLAYLGATTVVAAMRVADQLAGLVVGGLVAGMG